MPRIIVQITFVALLACASNVASFQFTNPHYITSRVDPRSGHTDTIAVLTCSADPEYMKQSKLDIKYIVQTPVRDSLVIYLSDGEICNFNWDKYSYVWRGNFEAGDTLKCSFNFTPLVVGAMGVTFRINFSPHNWVVLPFGLILDENGLLVRSIERSGGPEFGMLGVLPGKLGDSLVFTGDCGYWIKESPGPTFVISALFSPLFAAKRPGRVIFTIVSAFDADLGVSYQIRSSEQFSVQMSDSSDWQRPVRRGDTLRVAATIEPVAAGVGFVELDVIGQRSSDTKPGGRFIESRLKVDLAIDQSLFIVAYAKGELYDSSKPSILSPQRPNDAYRLSTIEALPRASSVKKAASVNYERTLQESTEQNRTR